MKAGIKRRSPIKSLLPVIGCRCWNARLTSRDLPPLSAVQPSSAALGPALHITLPSSARSAAPPPTGAISVSRRAGVDGRRSRSARNGGKCVHTQHNKSRAEHLSSSQIHARVGFHLMLCLFGLARCFSLLNYQVTQHSISMLANPPRVYTLSLVLSWFPLMETVFVRSLSLIVSDLLFLLFLFSVSAWIFDALCTLSRLQQHAGPLLAVGLLHFQLDLETIFVSMLCCKQGREEMFQEILKHVQTGWRVCLIKGRFSWFFFYFVIFWSQSRFCIHPPFPKRQKCNQLLLFWWKCMVPFPWLQ